MNILVIFIFIGLVAYFTWQGSVNKKQASENIALGNAFLENNKQQEGVRVSSTGLQILQLQSGTGSEHPKATSKVKVHYHGMLIDGTVFDSSVKRGEPLTFGLNQVISGWTEGLQLMVEGEKARLFIPSNLGYGAHKSGSIPANSVLIFDVELLEIL